MLVFFLVAEATFYGRLKLSMFYCQVCGKIIDNLFVDMEEQVSANILTTTFLYQILRFVPVILYLLVYPRLIYTHISLLLVLFPLQFK